MFYRACSAKWDATFTQAFATFARENNYAWPDPAWPLMPLYEHDHFRRVVDVPLDRLRMDADDPSLPTKVLGFLKKHRPELSPDGAAATADAPEPTGAPF
jgi:hypothetical protein